MKWKFLWNINLEWISNNSYTKLPVDQTIDYTLEYNPNCTPDYKTNYRNDYEPYYWLHYRADTGL